MVLFNSDRISAENKIDILNALQNFDMNPDIPFVIMTLNQDGTVFMRKLNCNSNDLKLFAMDLLEDSIIHYVATNEDYMNEIRKENGYDIIDYTNLYQEDDSINGYDDLNDLELNDENDDDEDN